MHDERSPRSRPSSRDWRLNAIAAKLAALDFDKTPAFELNGLKLEELAAMNSTLLHEIYFACLGGEGKNTDAMLAALAKDFGSADRWRAEFTAMGRSLAGGSGWVLLSYVPRDKRLVNQYAADRPQSIAVFCAYGFHVGCRTAQALRSRGFDARYMAGGHSAWKAIGGELEMHA